LFARSKLLSSKNKRLTFFVTRTKLPPVANNAVTIEQPLDGLDRAEHSAAASAIEQRRRRHILRVVATVVAEEGFTGATMRRIAERAGVSTGMLTYYYKNKREILRDMLADIYTRLIESLNDVAGGKMGEERIEATFEFMLKGSRNGTFPMSFWLSYFAEALQDEEIRREAIDGTNRLRRMFARAIQAGVHDGVLRGDLDADAGADLRMCLWQGLRVEVGLYNVSEERAARAVSQVLALMAK
jgi:TetR/AcrR family transcriptional regulator, transcriptional repressor of aconitase